MEIILLIIVVVLAVFILKQKKTTNKSDKNIEDLIRKIKEEGLDLLIEEPTEQQVQLNNTTEYIRGAYQHKWMFTQNEKPAYFKLKEIADKHGLLLFAKVRLWDLVHPISGHPKYKTNRYRIQAKHVDFVLCKSNLVAKYIIELDDSSHDTQKGKDRDLFVDTVLTSCGYKVLHTRTINEEEIEKFISE